MSAILCLQALLKAAERFQAVLAPPLSSTQDSVSPAVTAVHRDWDTSAISPTKSEANGLSNGARVDADEGLAAADLAAGWSRAATADNASTEMTTYALAGLAASIVVCGCPRCENWHTLKGAES